MPDFPLNLAAELGHWNQYVVYLVIGFAFGFVLEIAGFGHSPKLAAQFYFKDMTVLKVMFTAIIVAMSLIFLTSALGLLDYNLVYVNTTYLWPGIVGGLLMGVGFIVGGFCPGTSLVSAATLKLDGIIFAAGVFFGIFLFGETVGLYEDFWYSSYFGRYTLPELFGLDTGIVVLGILVMALFAFWGSEQLERLIGKMDLSKAPRWRYSAAGGLVALGVAGLIIGQPSAEDRWNRIADEKEKALADRAVQIEPLELLHLIFDDRLQIIMLDVRSERDYNLFHIEDAEIAPLPTLTERAEDLLEQPENTVVIMMSNDEAAATEAWRALIAESVPNVYILEGGLNNWIETFADEEFMGEHPRIDTAEDALAYRFEAALGSRYLAAQPYIDQYEDAEYQSKVKLQLKRGPGGGGCG